MDLDSRIGNNICGERLRFDRFVEFLKVAGASMKIGEREGNQRRIDLCGIDEMCDQSSVSKRVGSKKGTGKIYGNKTIKSVIISVSGIGFKSVFPRHAVQIRVDCRN